MKPSSFVATFILPGKRERRIVSSSSSSSSSSINLIFPDNNNHVYNDFMSSSSSPPFSLMLSSVDDTMTVTTTTFEPVLNVPAFITFLFITIIFSVLIIRTNQVEQAVQERNDKLQQLRTLKTKELDNTNNISPADIQQSLQEYELAVQKEEKLRNIIPGVVRIVPPSAGNIKEEDASIIAKQLLGKDYEIGIPKQERNTNGTLSPIAIGALIAVGTILVSLLAFLSMMYITTGGGESSATSTMDIMM